MESRKISNYLPHSQTATICSILTQALPSCERPPTSVEYCRCCNINELSSTN